MATATLAMPTSEDISEETSKEIDAKIYKIFSKTLIRGGIDITHSQVPKGDSKRLEVSFQVMGLMAGPQIRQLEKDFYIQSISAKQNGSGMDVKLYTK